MVTVPRILVVKDVVTMNTKRALGVQQNGTQIMSLEPWILGLINYVWERNMGISKRDLQVVMEILDIFEVTCSLSFLNRIHHSFVNLYLIRCLHLVYTSKTNSIFWSCLWCLFKYVPSDFRSCTVFPCIEVPSKLWSFAIQLDISCMVRFRSTEKHCIWKINIDFLWLACV